MRDEEPTKDLMTRAFQKRVLDEFAAMRDEQAAMRKDFTDMRAEIGEMRSDIGEIRSDTAELRSQQVVIARHIAAIEQRLTTLEKCGEASRKETHPIWEAVQEQLQRLVEKFDAVLQDLYEVRGEMKIHGRRIGRLEGRTS